MNANPSYINFKQLFRITLLVRLVSTLSTLAFRFSGGTVCFCFGLLAATGEGAGDEAPLAAGFGVDAPDVPPVFLMSARHLDTNSIACFTTAGSLCVLSLLTVTPIFVERRRSSEACTPRRRSSSSVSIVDEGSPPFTAFAIARPFSSTSLVSITMAGRVIRVRFGR